MLVDEFSVPVTKFTDRFKIFSRVHHVGKGLLIWSVLVTLGCWISFFTIGSDQTMNPVSVGSATETFPSFNELVITWFGWVKWLGNRQNYSTKTGL